MQYIFRFLSLNGASFDKIKVKIAIFVSFNIQLYRFFSPKRYLQITFCVSYSTILQICIVFLIIFDIYNARVYDIIIM